MKYIQDRNNYNYNKTKDIEKLNELLDSDKMDTKFGDTLVGGILHRLFGFGRSAISSGKMKIYGIQLDRVLAAMVVEPVLEAMNKDRSEDDKIDIQKLSEDGAQLEANRIINSALKKYEKNPKDKSVYEDIEQLPEDSFKDMPETKRFAEKIKSKFEPKKDENKEKEEGLNEGDIVYIDGENDENENPKEYQYVKDDEEDENKVVLRDKNGKEEKVDKSKIKPKESNNEDGESEDNNSESEKSEKEQLIDEISKMEQEKNQVQNQIGNSSSEKEKEEGKSYIKNLDEKIEKSKKRLEEIENSKLDSEFQEYNNEELEYGDIVKTNSATYKYLRKSENENVSICEDENREEVNINKNDIKQYKKSEEDIEEENTENNTNKNIKEDEHGLVLAGNKKGVKTINVNDNITYNGEEYEIVKNNSTDDKITIRSKKDKNKTISISVSDLESAPTIDISKIQNGIILYNNNKLSVVKNDGVSLYTKDVNGKEHKIDIKSGDISDSNSSNPEIEKMVEEYKEKLKNLLRYCDKCITEERVKKNIQKVVKSTESQIESLKTKTLSSKDIEGVRDEINRSLEFINNKCKECEIGVNENYTANYLLLLEKEINKLEILTERLFGKKEEEKNEDGLSISEFKKIRRELEEKSKKLKVTRKDLEEIDKKAGEKGIGGVSGKLSKKLMEVLTKAKDSLLHTKPYDQIRKNQQRYYDKLDKSGRAINRSAYQSWVKKVNELTSYYKDQLPKPILTLVSDSLDKEEIANDYVKLHKEFLGIDKRGINNKSGFNYLNNMDGKNKYVTGYKVGDKVTYFSVTKNSNNTGKVVKINKDDVDIDTGNGVFTILKNKILEVQKA